MSDAPRYWLRYPTPWNTQQALDDLSWAWRKKYMQGVLLFVGPAEERAPGLLTLAEVRSWLDEYAPVLDYLRRQRVPWGFNIWCTIGFSRINAGLPRRATPFQPMVGNNGVVVQEWTCPLDENFRAFLEQKHALLASENPESIWIDDDFRYMGRNPAPAPCFCPLHLREMARRTGQKWSIESLRLALADPDHQKGQLRRTWLDLQHDSMADVLRRVRKAIERVNDSTHLCLMTGAVEHRAVDGWRWHEMLSELSQPARLRPGLGHYTGGDNRAFLMGLAYARQTQAAAPRGADFWPEIENYPGGLFSRSTRSMEQQIALSALCDMGRDVTVNINGFLGTPLPECEPILKAFAGLGPAIAQINQAVRDFPDEQGLMLPMRERTPLHSDWSSPEPWPWYHFRAWDSALPCLGLAVTLNEQRASVSVAGSGQLAAAMGWQAIAQAIRGGLLVDGGFARVMQTMRKLPVRPRVAGDAAGPVMEQIADPDFGQVGDTMSLRMHPRLWRIDPGRNGRVISWLLDPRGQRIAPGMVLYDTPAGRLAVTAIDTQALTDQWSYFRSAARKQQLRQVLNWLGTVPLFIRHHPDVLPILRTGPGGALVGIANLRDDPMGKVELELGSWTGKAPSKIEQLDQRGRWKPVSFNAQPLGQGLLVRLPAPAATSPAHVWRLLR